MFSASLGYWKQPYNVVPATGGTISLTDIDGIPYQVHTFLTNGNFTTSTSILDCTVLLVAPGGAGVSGGISGNIVYVGGGGGGGAVYPFTFITNTSTAYFMTVGTGATNSISQAFGFTTYGGGSGGTLGPGTAVGPVGPYSAVGTGGGSGGGGGARSNISFTSSQTQGGGSTAQLSTFGYGLANTGGAGTASNPVIVGGQGGGAGASGAGYISDINGTTVEYGVGGTGQSYNFQAGGAIANGVRAPGLGAGGGGGGQAGRNGVVIIRYPLIV
jgi:hypothetical protein